MVKCVPLLPQESRRDTPLEHGEPYNSRELIFNNIDNSQITKALNIPIYIGYNKLNLNRK